MPRPLTNNPSGQSSWVSTLVSSPSPRGFAASGIPITQQADIEQVLGLNASSEINITDRVGDIASLSASNALSLSVDTDKLHVLNHSASSPITITDLMETTGGRASVKQSNPDGFVYIKGCEFTDGSLRLLPDSVGENVEFQLRTDGVWNETGIQIAGTTIHVGRDLDISAAGEYIQTRENRTEENSLIPQVPFNDNGTGFPHTPVLGKKIVRVLLQPDESSEVTGTTLQTTTGNPLTRVVLGDVLASRFYLKTGSIGATAPTTITFRRGGALGPIFFQQILPVSLMELPNTEFSVDLFGFLEGDPEETVTVQLISDETISLKSDSSGIFFGGIDGFPFSEVDLLQENLLLANDAGLIVTNNASFAVGNLI